MPLKPGVTTGEIAEHVRSTYRLDTRHVSLIAGRAHAEATAYRVDANERSYFLKLTPDQRGSPSPLARHLAYSGISHVLALLRTHDGQLSARLGDLQATLYPFIEGENGFRAPLNQEQWTMLGGAMRAIHDIKLPTSVSESMRRETYSDIWRNKTRRYLTAVTSERPGDSVACELTAFLSSKRAEIVRPVEHAERLVRVLSRKALPRCHVTATSTRATSLATASGRS